MTFNPLAITDTPTLSISSSASDTICNGTSVHYTSTISGGGSTTTYQWLVNGSVTSTTGSSYNYTPANGDSIQCMVTTTNPCSSPSYAGSNVIHMVVNPVVTPTVSIAASPHDTVCSGTVVTYISTITGGGSVPAYTWLVNGMVAGTGSSYSYTPVNGDSVSCRLVSNAACATADTVFSNMVHMVVNPIVTPTIAISTVHDTVCSGTVVTYISTITGGGSVPGYQWQVNGTASGTGISFSYTPVNGDSISCVLSSSAACVSSATIASNVVHMVVDPLDTPFITITASPGDTLCVSGAVSFSSMISMGGSSPTYQWIVDGTGVGTSTPTYTYSPANGDSVRCILTSSALCATPHTISSNTILMVVDTLTIPTITLSGPAAAAIGSLVTVTAAVTGAGSSYTIEWMNQGVVFNTTTVPAVSYTKVNNTDSVTARVVPIGRCYDSSVSGLQTVFNSNEGVTTPADVSCVVWPNPAHDLLKISSPVTIQKVTIINLPGQELLCKEYNADTAVLNIQNLPDGVYMVKITGSDGAVTMRKLLKE